jgi:hypothetical protein
MITQMAISEQATNSRASMSRSGRPEVPGRAYYPVSAPLPLA